jgi:DNA-binding beta-propeller fold protein YncE
MEKTKLLSGLGGRWVVVLGGVLGLAGCVTTAPKVEQKTETPVIVFPQPPAEARFYFERSFRKTSDVEKLADRSALEIVAGKADQDEILVKPYGVAAYKGKVYVSDVRGVALFDLPNKRYKRIGDGSDSPVVLNQPFGLTHDAKGNLYVVDGQSKSVQIFSPEGNHLNAIGGQSVLRRPSGIAVEPDGSRIYVVDTGGVDEPKNHHVRVFDPAGKVLLDIGKRGADKGDLNLPRDVALGKDGLLYVVDGGNFRVNVYDRQGKFMRSFGQIGRSFGQFARPKEVGIDPEGNVYVVDTAFGNFQIFNAEGQMLLDVGTRGERDEPAKYMLPSGIAVDEDGRVYMVDQFFARVDVYRPAKLDEKAGHALGSAKAAVPAKGAEPGPGDKKASQK